MSKITDAGEIEILRLFRRLSPEKRRAFVQMLHLLMPVVQP
jgi:hypothetical protein